MNAQPRSHPVDPSRTTLIARIGVAAIALVLGACQSPAASTSPAASFVGSSPSAIASSEAPVVASPSPIVIDTAPPSAEPSTPPAPSASPVSSSTGWSSPVAIAGLAGCGSLVGAIDDRGTIHLAVSCYASNGSSSVKYATSTDGRQWTTIAFSPPTGRFELEPQLAFDGNTLALAYSRVAPTDGGCGDDGLSDVGVYVRTKTLPSGGWSAPVRIGAVGDRLESFRVTRGVTYATVTNQDGTSTFYESLAAGKLTRFPLAAAGGTSLRVGSDGVARIAYEASGGLSLGTVGPNGIKASPIPDSAQGWDPILVLAPGNVADVLWNWSYHGGGCAGPGPDPHDGAYFSTNAGGVWTTTRLSTSPGAISLTLDSAGGLHALVDDADGLAVHDRLPGSPTWTHELLTQSGAEAAVIRQDPATGRLVVAYAVDPNADGSVEIDVITRP
jgi:hypothetical protein